MAFLSIIVPVYNKVNYLDECLQSILNQKFGDYELILVNDGSTDGSLEKCKDYARSDKRIRVIEQENQGVSAARNSGLDCASGKYIGFIDSDDTIDSDMYALLTRNALEYDADISVCRLRVIFPKKTVSPSEVPGAKVYNGEDALTGCLKGDFDRSANNKIYKRQIIEDIRFEGRYNEDILYTCKAFLNAEKVVCENVVKYNYLIRGNSTSMSSFNSNYFDIVDISDKIVSLVASKNSKSLPEAMNFDVVANISILNLLLLTGKDENSHRYKQIVNKLSSYRDFILESNIIRLKHKYAYKLFAFSPKIYTSLMYIYCLVTQTEVIKRIEDVQHPAQS